MALCKPAKWNITYSDKFRWLCWPVKSVSSTPWGRFWLNVALHHCREQCCIAVHLFLQIILSNHPIKKLTTYPPRREDHIRQYPNQNLPKLVQNHSWMVDLAESSLWKSLLQWFLVLCPTVCWINLKGFCAGTPCFQTPICMVCVSEVSNCR